MQKHNKHWRRTHEKLQTLTFELLKTTVPERITVKQLCVAAKINRSTFYAHYLDVFDLVTQTQAVKRREMMCGFIAPAQHEKLKFLDPESLQQFLTFVRDNGWFYKIILRSRHDFPIQEGFDQLYQLLLTPVKKSTPELADDDLMYLFITFQASFTMILRHWSENDYNKTPAQIAQLIINSLPNLIFQAHFGRPAV